MKTKILYVILTYVNFMLVQGLDLHKTNKSPDRRIVNGKPAKTDNFRYLVRLENYGDICAGAIITEMFVLTAAHCIYEQTCSDIEIHPAQWHPQQIADAVECWPHPQFTGTLEYDIGLIKSRENLLGDERLESIDLPSPGVFIPPGTVVTIAGWGLSESHQSRPLLWAEFLVKEWDFCNNHYAGYCDQNPNCIAKDIPRSIICVQGKDTPIPITCLGDSGGPVVTNDMIVGVDSFGMPSEDPCPPGAPTMHTSVGDYMPWIGSIVNERMYTGGVPVESEPEY